MTAKTKILVGLILIGGVGEFCLLTTCRMTREKGFSAKPVSEQTTKPRQARRKPEDSARIRKLPPNRGKDSAKPDSPEEAERWRRMILMDEHGNIPPDGLVNAIEQREANLEFQRQSAALRGSSESLSALSWKSHGPLNVGGRTWSLVIHPNFPNIFWALSDTGGIWKSSDGGRQWMPAGDSLPNQLIYCLTIDPRNPNLLYAGVGNSTFGGGIYKSTDGGANWSRLPSTANWHTSTKSTVRSLAVSPFNSNLIFAGTGGGLARSTDGGNSWSDLLPNTSVWEIVFHPFESAKVLAVGQRYDFNLNQYQYFAFYSLNGGSSWSQSNFAGVGAVLNEVPTLAYARSNPSVVYARIQANNQGQIWRSTDGGLNYVMVNNAAGPGWSNALWVSPTDPNFIVAGSYDLFKSSDGGRTLTQISDGYLITDEPHPDQLFIVADPGFNGTGNKRVYVCNDGGVFRTEDIFTASKAGGWTGLNLSYLSTQFYKAVGHGGTGLIIGGTQDNGTLRLTADSSTAGLMYGGDGGFSEIDPSDDRFCYGEYIFLEIHRSQNRGLTSRNIDSGIGDARKGHAFANFVAPFVLDPNDSNRMLAGGLSLWRSNDVRAGNPPAWTAIRSAGSKPISAIAVAQGNSNLIWIAQNDGKIYRTGNGLAANPSWIAIDDNAGVNPLPNLYPTKILIDPDNHNKVYVAFGGFRGGNLRRTLNGGATWSDISSSGGVGLPAAPINGIARHPQNSNWLFVGTEVGLFQSENGGGTWAAVSGGSGNISVTDVNFMHRSTRLLVATYGRGVWSIETGGANCGLTLATASQAFPAGGGAGVISVNASGACPWSAASNAPWLTVTGGASGTGNGSVNFAVSANIAAVPRAGVISVGDQSVTVTQSASAVINSLANISAASFSNSGVSAPESMVAAFGTRLAVTTQVADSTPLPTALAGTRVTVRDSQGIERFAPLFFVSASQINYLMPSGTALGGATITVTSGDGSLSSGAVTIAAVAPGLFSAEASGQGIAAANVLRVKADGRQLTEPVARYDSVLRRLVLVPIDLGEDTGAAGDQVFLILFGTGLRFRSSLSAVSARIANVEVPVLYTGAQGGFVGLDQINLRLPRSLFGQGEAQMILTVDGRQTNPLKISIRGLPPIPCSQESSLRSVEGKTQTAIDFINQTSATAKIHWLNYGGQRQHYATLPPGGSGRMISYLTMPWVVTDSQDRCKAIYQSPPLPARAIIEE